MDAFEMTLGASWILQSLASLVAISIAARRFSSQSSRAWIWSATALAGLAAAPYSWHTSLVNRLFDSLPFASASSQSLFQSLNPAIACIWALGAGWVAIRRLAGWLHLRRLCRDESKGPESEQWRSTWQRVAGRAQSQSSPALIRVRFQQCIPTPAIWVGGFGSPWLLLPTEAESWSELVREHVCRHELAHAFGCDPALRRIWHVLDLAFWWNPIWWRLKERLELELEKLADRAATQGEAPNAIRQYAETLLQLAIGNSGPRLELPAWSGTGGIEERIHTLLSASLAAPKPQLTFLQPAAAIALLTVISALHSHPHQAFALEEQARDAELRLAANAFPAH